jgi:hypothetical protein
MTYRALVERNTTAGVLDTYGNAQAPTWVTQIASQPCYYWQPRQGVETQGERNYLAYGHQLLLPLGVDIAEGDRINGITDRRRGVVCADVLAITAIMRKPDHLLLTLEVIK